MVHWAAPWEREKEKHVCNHALSLLHQPQVRKQWKRVCLSGWLTQVQSASTSVILREADLSACCFSWSSFLWPGFSGCTVQLVPELHRVEGRHEWSQGQSQGSRAPPSAYPWVQAVTLKTAASAQNLSSFVLYPWSMFSPWRIIPLKIPEDLWEDSLTFPASAKPLHRHPQQQCLFQGRPVCDKVSNVLPSKCGHSTK